MNEVIIGLAGHIDHGKTSLIKSLTNEFSGSLKEDLDRGMTIDLGIAFLDKKITIIENYDEVIEEYFENLTKTSILLTFMKGFFSSHNFFFFRFSKTNFSMMEKYCLFGFL